jgi:hypothetical protein
MRIGALVMIAVALGVSGCVNYHVYSSGEAACLELPPADPRAPKGYSEWLRYWQSTAYCQRVREQWFAGYAATLPDLIVEEIGDCPRGPGMANPPTVQVKNVGRGNSPAFDAALFVHVYLPDGTEVVTMNYSIAAPPLTPGQNQRLTLPRNQPFMVVSQDRIEYVAVADPLRGGGPGVARGLVPESDEGNNNRTKTCVVP